MEYLKAALSLLSLIKETNSKLIQDIQSSIKTPNQMLIQFSNEHKQLLNMETFSNDFVNSTLSKNASNEAFVITEVATMNVKGHELTYFLYKGYHSKVEKGLVFYQMFNANTFEIIGDLEFSNVEDNIFYSVEAPQVEESSCNAMETDEVIKNGKSIVFLLGHMDEQRLIYDIQRLIFDTVNNVSKHSKLSFSFIIQIARYGGTPSEMLKKQVAEIEKFTTTYVYSEYPNASFKFEYEVDASLN